MSPHTKMEDMTMVSLSTAKTDPEKLVWDELDRISAGMLGLEKESFAFSRWHPIWISRPKSIWFYPPGQRPRSFCDEWRSGNLLRSLQRP